MRTNKLESDFKQLRLRSCTSSLDHRKFKDDGIDVTLLI